MKSFSHNNFKKTSTFDPGFFEIVM